MKHEFRASSGRRRTAGAGISLMTSVGVAVAVQIYWSINHSIGWAIWHGMLNWIYVVYRWIVGGG